MTCLIEILADVRPIWKAQIQYWLEENRELSDSGFSRINDANRLTLNKK